MDAYFNELAKNLPLWSKMASYLVGASYYIREYDDNDSSTDDKLFQLAE